MHAWGTDPTLLEHCHGFVGLHTIGKGSHTGLLHVQIAAATPCRCNWVRPAGWQSVVCLLASSGGQQKLRGCCSEEKVVKCSY